MRRNSTNEVYGLTHARSQEGRTAMLPEDGSLTATRRLAGRLKQAGWVGPAFDRLKQEVAAEFRRAVADMEAHPDAPQWALARRLSPPDEFRKLAQDPPSELIEVLAPVLCPTLAWVRMFDKNRLPQQPGRGRSPWQPSEQFKAAQRALQNGWYEDALTHFRAAVDEANPEDFVSLYGLSQLALYWEARPKEAIPLLERAARYAVPVNAEAWMKSYAAESFLARAELVADVQNDLALARQHLDNAEMLAGSRPEIDLARARLAIRTGDVEEVAKCIESAVSRDWMYALQVALDPAFTTDVADQVLAALEQRRDSVRASAEERAGTVRGEVERVLAEPDDDIAPEALADAKRELHEALEHLERLLADPEPPLLAALALGGRVADLERTVRRAVEHLRDQRKSIRDERERLALAAEIAELESQRDEVVIRRQRLAEAESEAEERFRKEEAEAIERAKREMLQRIIRRSLYWVVPALVLFLVYMLTEIGPSGLALRGASGPVPTQSAPEAGAPQPKRPAPTVGTFSGQVAPGVPGNQPEVQPEPTAAAPSPQFMYHAVLDRWVWLLFIIYVGACVALIYKAETEEYRRRSAYISRTTQDKREEALREMARRREPVEREYRALTQRIEALRARQP